MRQPFQLACRSRARARDVRIAPVVVVEEGCAASPNRTYGHLSLVQEKLRLLGASYAAAREARAKEARRILETFARFLSKRSYPVSLIVSGDVEIASAFEVVPEIRRRTIFLDLPTPSEDRFLPEVGAVAG
jgi:hypothetical protein